MSSLILLEFVFFGMLPSLTSLEEIMKQRYSPSAGTVGLGPGKQQIPRWYEHLFIGGGYITYLYNLQGLICKQQSDYIRHFTQFCHLTKCELVKYCPCLTDMILGLLQLRYQTLLVLEQFNLFTKQVLQLPNTM